MSQELLANAIIDLELSKIPYDNLEDYARSLAFICENKQFGDGAITAASNKLVELLSFVKSKNASKEAAAIEHDKIIKERMERTRKVAAVLRDPDSAPSPKDDPVLFIDIMTQMTGMPPGPGSVVTSQGVDWMMTENGDWEAIGKAPRKPKKKPLTRRK